MNAKTYPTLAAMARDILAVPASSVPCERLFSGGKLIATDRRSRLGSDRFEEIQIMKSAWSGDVVDWAELNSAQVEEVKYREFEGLLSDDVSTCAWAEEMIYSDVE